MKMDLFVQNAGKKIISKGQRNDNTLVNKSSRPQYGIYWPQEQGQKQEPVPEVRQQEGLQQPPIKRLGATVSTVERVITQSSINPTGLAASRRFTQAIAGNSNATTPEPNFIREKRDRQGVVPEPKNQQEPLSSTGEGNIQSSEESYHPTKKDHALPESLVDASDKLDDKQKEEVNRRLLQSGGILRDYDSNEVLYPMNLAVLSVLENMLKEAKAAL